MKFSANAGGLARALDLAALPLGGSQVRKIAVLGAVRLAAARGDDGRITVRSNILDLSIDAIVAGAEIEEAGEIAVPGERLAALITATAPDRAVTITSTDNDATITAGRSRYKLPTLPFDQLPKPLSLEEIVGEIELDCDEALHLFTRTQFAVSTEETRYYLNGIFLQTTGDTLTTVATDGHRLVRIITPMASNLSSDRRCIVPLASTKIIIKILRSAKPDTIVRLRRAPALFEINVGDVSLVSKLIDGEFPQYERLFPQPSDNNAIVDRRELAQAVERLAAVAETTDQKMRVTRLSWGVEEDGLHLALANDAGEDVLEADTGGVGGVAVQITHLAQLLDELEGKRISLNVNSPGDAILVGDPDDERLLILQMPCRF